jgi:hypothetical protein
MLVFRRKRYYEKIYRARIVFNGRRQLVSDISRYLVTWMPQRKIFCGTEILLFDFELFIGDRCDLLGCSQLASFLESLFTLQYN